MNFLERTNGEKLVAAGNATIGGHTEQAFERSGKAGYVLWSDALEILIAADSAMSGKAVGERRGAAAKALSAAGAPPRQAADKSGGEIHKCTSARPTAGRRMAGGTNHQRCSFE